MFVNKHFCDDEFILLNSILFILMKRKRFGIVKMKKNRIETSQRVPHTGTNSTRGDLAS